MSEVEGLQELQSKLKEIAKVLSTDEFLKFGEAGMTVHVEAEAKRRCPVDESRLRPSIVTVIDKEKVITGTNVEYGPYVEYGTGKYAEGGKGRKTPWAYKYEGKKGPKGWRMTEGQHAQPYMRPSWDEGKSKVVSHMETAAQDKLRRVV